MDRDKQHEREGTVAHPFFGVKSKNPNAFFPIGDAKTWSDGVNYQVPGQDAINRASAGLLNVRAQIEANNKARIAKEKQDKENAKKAEEKALDDELKLILAELKTTGQGSTPPNSTPGKPVPPQGAGALPQVRPVNATGQGSTLPNSTPGKPVPPQGVVHRVTDSVKVEFPRYDTGGDSTANRTGSHPTPVRPNALAPSRPAPGTAARPIAPTQTKLNFAPPRASALPATSNTANRTGSHPTPVQSNARAPTQTKLKFPQQKLNVAPPRAPALPATSNMPNKTGFQPTMPVRGNTFAPPSTSAPVMAGRPLAPACTTGHCPLQARVPARPAGQRLAPRSILTNAVGTAAPQYGRK